MPIFPNRFNELDRPPVRLGEARLALGSRRSTRISEITADEADTVHPYSIFDRAWVGKWSRPHKTCYGTYDLLLIVLHNQIQARRSIALEISYRLQQVAEAIADFNAQVAHQLRVKARHRRAQMCERVLR